MTRQTRTLLIFAVLMSVAFYVYIAIPTCTQFGDGCYSLHRDIVAHTAPSTYEYRWLVPALVSLFVPGGSNGALVVAYVALTFLCLAVLYPALYSWLRAWMHEDRAMLGIFLTVAAFALGFHFWYLSAWSLVEMTFIVIWLNLIRRDVRLWNTLPIIVLAALNRETNAPLLIAIFAAIYWDRRRERHIIYTGVLFVGAWLLTTVFLHIAFAAQSQYVSLIDQFEANLKLLPETIFANLFLLPLWFAVIGNYGKAAPVFKRFVWIAALYVVSIIVGAVWLEAPRQLLSILPLMLPVILVQPTAAQVNAGT